MRRITTDATMTGAALIAVGTDSASGSIVLSCTDLIKRTTVSVSGKRADRGDIVRDAPKPTAGLSIRVVIATKGRPAALATLLHWLSKQSRLPEVIVAVGTCAADLPTMKTLSAVPVVSLLSPRPGLTVQRNMGVEHLRRHLPAKSGVIVFFDDDFRPDRDWLQRCEWAFEDNASVVGVTGRVLADGVATGPIEEATAARLLAGIQLPPQSVGTSGIGTLYGCNMAVRETMFEHHRFCEELPNYGWLEDVDFSGQISGSGDLVVATTCVGVHLGVADARMDPRQLGYSEIANPLWLRRRRTISRSKCLRILVRRTVAPAVKSLGGSRAHFHRGRLSGVAAALLHLALGRLHPMAITGTLQTGHADQPAEPVFA
jgi:hypothetical protein